VKELIEKREGNKRSTKNKPLSISSRPEKLLKEKTSKFRRRTRKKNEVFLGTHRRRDLILGAAAMDPDDETQRRI